MFGSRWRAVSAAAALSLTVVTGVAATPALSATSSATSSATLRATLSGGTPAGEGRIELRESGPGVVSSPLPGASRRSQANGRAVAFSPKSFFYQDISKAPLATNTKKIAADLAAQVNDHWGGIAAFNAYKYNAGFNLVPAGTKRITVGYWNCQNKSWMPHGLFDRDRHFVDVPVPDDAVPAAGSDAEMTLYDPASDQLWEFWKMRRNAETNAWEACWGGRIDTVSKSQGVFPQWFGASASGIALAGGMITMEEVRSGVINHAMYLGTIRAQHWQTYSWPANRSDGYVRDADVVMQGQRLRLNPRLNLKKYKLTKIGLMVAKAAQKYGFVVCDKGGAVALITESGELAKARTGDPDPWNELMGGPSYTVMAGFPWDQMQVLPADYGKPTA